MSPQRLNARSIRRIERAVGGPVVMAWSHGSYWMSFLTPDHRHGAWHRRDNTVQWPDPTERAFHYTSCEQLLSDYAARTRAAT